jgi:MFS family permease
MRTTLITAVAAAKLICWRPFARRSTSRAPEQGTISTVLGHIALVARHDALTRKRSQAYPLRDHLFSILSRASAVVTPALVVYLIAASGWRAMFYILGAVGTAWVFAWYASYRNAPADYPKGRGAELALLPALPILAQSGWKRDVPSRRILRNRDLRRLSTVYFCNGLVVWLYLAWLPTYSKEAHHFAGLKPDLASLPVLRQPRRTSVAVCYPVGSLPSWGIGGGSG